LLNFQSIFNSFFAIIVFICNRFYFQIVFLGNFSSFLPIFYHFGQFFIIFAHFGKFFIIFWPFFDDLQSFLDLFCNI